MRIREAGERADVFNSFLLVEWVVPHLNCPLVLFRLIIDSWDDSQRPGRPGHVWRDCVEKSPECKQRTWPVLHASVGSV